MQTFLPFPSFEKSARVLDPKRLGRQRVEVLQILRAHHVPGYGWQHHPAVVMWRDLDEALVSYGMTVVSVWVGYGYIDRTAPLIAEFAGKGGPLPQCEVASMGLLPWWVGWRPFHRSHQSALVRKDPARYRRHFPRVPADLPYVWPRPEGPAERTTGRGRP